MTEARPKPDFSLILSHLELYVRDTESMEDFYTRILGFVVTDRGPGPGAMVFLSRNRNEHHQIVLNPRPSGRAPDGPLDHISFRVESLDILRRVYGRLKTTLDSMETVCHGTAWSVYFRDPENNRLEIFADTPWYVSQPCRFSVDLELDDDDLHHYTREKIRELPGFQSVEEWRRSHNAVIDKDHQT